MTENTIGKILRKVIEKIETDQETIRAIFKASGSPNVSPPKDKDSRNGESGKPKV